MNKRSYLTFIIGIIVILAVIGSGCTDSNDTGTEEEYEEPVADTTPEEVEVDDSTYTNSIGMEFVKIPEGEFYMGAPSEEAYSDKNERPVHYVSIGYDYYMGAYEVTQEQWEAVMGDEPSKFEGADLPVEQISWVSANEFVEKLNGMEGTESYRLPTEAEWEYACRAGTETAFSFGDDSDLMVDYGWFDDNSEDKTRPVGMKEANPWGLYDMHGNVAEWVLDEYHSNYNDAPTDGTEWTGGVDRRVIRGGSWENSEDNCRSAVRDSIGEGSRADYVGFRIIKEI
ncbi:formylglycine-generating enzyme family protein [Methanolobus profundi]|uniref:Formylglycine-generating enzyme, required for sulfatase activity, contains SUMF1/FGE domain n=1 Tax=Methanolobus profundi TaxID=487685 RepID=A0A1I4PXT4_9EURY|nr:formylglycine-generating enzyme family protein [Methanolobus profundi]SFM32250.1 Formylglycine-generating enzyme, required for sulfatase activity, contains SUMF1/FGE domain [Methanolobus profundi]